MSENLVSEPMKLNHSTRMNPIMMRTDPSTTNSLMGSYNSSTLQQMPISNLQSISKDAMMNLTASQEMSMANESMGNFQPMTNSFSAQNVPKWQLEQMKALQANQGHQNTSLKRKASPDNLTPNNEEMQKISASAKRMTHARSHPNSSVPSVLSVPNKISSQAGTVSYSPRSGNPNRKVVQLEAVPNRSHPQRNRNEESPKVQPEQSFGSVRSKLTEQLAAALALVSQQKKTLDKADRHGLSEVGSADASKQDNVKVPNLTQPGEKPVDAQSASDVRATVEPWKSVGQEFQSNPVLPYEETSFSDNLFAKDELLLGNGLAWDMDLDAKVGGAKTSEQPRAQVDGISETVLSPEAVAVDIESELFKLFGGLNKKYKEKGRSLVFNLKDKNNPELRERVMSGEISPERLCSMTAEELASKELSEWRIAKAEQLAHMKELPDADVRRLVKKTHKGEFEVEAFETEVSAPVDGLVGGNSVVRDQSEVTGSKGKSGTGGVKNDAGETDDTITIPSESGDIMQGLMVDDMNDLPPIVSLDEFMESLDKEPPFESLPVDSDKASSDGGSDSKSSERASKVSAENVARKVTEVGPKGILKSSGNGKPVPIKREYVWEGVLQLTVTSSAANFVGVLKSGEKTGTKDWPRFFEIKGRVRLEAFEKFIHELPNSRSRAIMVVHFSLDVACTDKEQGSLQELVDSYKADERLGFAEPTPGTEIYFVPPGAKTLEMLNKHLPTSYTRTLDGIDNGLIGIVVWRKALPPPTISPKSSHQKNSGMTMRQQNNSSYPPATPVRPSHDRNTNSNINFSTRDVAPPPTIPDNNNNEDEDDDDVPPGFGAKRDDDDLPEFSFAGSGSVSGLINPVSQQKIPVHGNPERLPSPTPTPTPPDDKCRQLILKYGTNHDLAPTPLPPPPPRGGVGGIVLQPWNDDEDDDDIPEWQPQQPLPPSQLPPLRPHFGVGNQPLQPLQPPMMPQMGAPNGGPWHTQGGSGWWAGRPPPVTRGRNNQQQQNHHHGGSGSRGKPWMSNGSSRSRNKRGGY